MHMHQYDVATVYLNGKLEEDFFIEVSDLMTEVLEYIVTNRRGSNSIVSEAKSALDELVAGNKVCHINNALYGLKQAGLA